MDWLEKISKIKKVEKEGVFVKSKGFEFKIAAATEKYAKVLNEKVKENNLISIEHLTSEIVYETVIEELIKDWKGFQENGENIPFSVEKAKEILLKKDENEELFFKDTLEHVTKMTMNEDLYYKEAILKN